MKIETTCPKCNNQQEINVDENDYNSWKSGKLIQNAMPYLTASQREALMTGVCDPCWNELFPPEED